MRTDGWRASGISALRDGFEQVQLLGVAFVVEVDGVVAGEAGVAKALLLAVKVRVHPFLTQVCERVGLDETANLFHGIIRGDEFGAGRRIDAVVNGADSR